MSDEPSQSQSQRVYLWIFLFRADPDEEQPFSCHLIDKFKGSDFPFYLISGHLSLSERLKPRKLESLTDAKHCIFAKVEDGIYLMTFFNIRKKNIFGVK